MYLFWNSLYKKKKVRMFIHTWVSNVSLLPLQVLHFNLCQVPRRSWRTLLTPFTFKSRLSAVPSGPSKTRITWEENAERSWLLLNLKKIQGAHIIRAARVVLLSILTSQTRRSRWSWRSRKSWGSWGSHDSHFTFWTYKTWTQTHTHLKLLKNRLTLMIRLNSRDFN